MQRVYRAMNKPEMIGLLKDNDFPYIKTNKWFTPDFRFLFKRVLSGNFNRCLNYDYIVAIETDTSSFNRLNKKELMTKKVGKFNIVWLKSKKQLLEELRL